MMHMLLLKNGRSKAFMWCKGRIKSNSDFCKDIKNKIHASLFFSFCFIADLLLKPSKIMQEEER